MAIDLARSSEGTLLKEAKPLNARWGCIRPEVPPVAGAADYLHVDRKQRPQRRKAPLCEPPHRQTPMSMAGSHASAIDPARWTHANAPDPLLPGALRGAQFHASGRALRRLPALADQRHHSVGARTGRRAFSTQAAHRPHHARPRHTTLSRPDRSKRGACARGRAGAGRCAAGEFGARVARGPRREPVMPIELIMAAPVIAYAVTVALAFGRLLVWPRRLRAAHVGGRDRRMIGHPTTT